MNPLAMRLLAGAAALVATMAARRLVAATWHTTTRRPPPVDPSNPRTRLPDAIAWTVASAAAVALAQLLVQRGFVRNLVEPIEPAA